MSYKTLKFLGREFPTIGGPLWGAPHTKDYGIWGPLLMESTEWYLETQGNHGPSLLVIIAILGEPRKGT